MAVTKVRVKINGTWSTLTNSGTSWTGTITAPNTTSFNQSGGYYPVTVELTNDAGTVTTYDTNSAAFANDLKLYVKEKIKPVITLSQPTNGAYVTNNKYPIKFKVTDETGGSGVNLSNVKLKIDSTTISYNTSGMTYSAITNGYEFTYTPQTALSDGSHSITINASDNDGNSATAVTASFKVDTVAPVLNVSSPVTGFITNSETVTVQGTTSDATSSPVRLTVALNGGTAETVTVNEDGTFSKQITLVEGENTIVVKSVDSAGKSTTVTITGNLDTSVPKLKTITITPNPATTGETMTITIEVE